MNDKSAQFEGRDQEFRGVKRLLGGRGDQLGCLCTHEP